MVPKAFTRGLVMSLANPHKTKQKVINMNGIINCLDTTGDFSDVIVRNCWNQADLGKTKDKPFYKMLLNFGFLFKIS